MKKDESRSKTFIHDISLPLNADTLLYPGDAPVIITKLTTLNEDGWNLSKFSISSHAGTHVDSPLHIKDDGINISEIPLNKCYGSAVVLDFTRIEFGNSITEDDLKNYHSQIEQDDIVLLKTKNSALLLPSSGKKPHFKENFVDLSEDGAKYLLSIKKIKAVCIDFLSVGSKRVHEMLLQNGILVYESVFLKNIIPGRYTFVGFPLKLETEGSPVRCVLIKNN